ncbi:uncharacterized protein zgc:113276 isoform X2 [Acipenser ruthenus]|uniref:uncharacterized protein zgc:113276 isoform X2 n=1 Tax=Acipenser ruthenus TaxID=7906 RepID=UPI002741C3AF|nr:uncharacterized protein zgc:113276 isoform X2 [Acipenser ruthenus]
MLDVLIVGGGPHALTLATLLKNPCFQTGSPHSEVLDGIVLSKKKSKNGRAKTAGKNRAKQTQAGQEDEPMAHKDMPSCPPLSIKVVDLYGEWMTLWEKQFAALNIPHLRSHTLVHTDPLNKVQKYHLESILVRGTVDRIIPVLEPATDVLQNQCDHKRALYFKVVLQSGEAIESKQVVMATGPTRTQMANIPSWVTAISESYPEERLQHTVQLMHLHNVHQQNQPHVCQKGDRLMVVGGGLTSAHIISFALQQGASQVTWVMRKHLQLKQFDVGDIETLVGRYSHVEHGIKLDGLAYLRQFYNERSLHKRLIMIRQARKGGAVTPEAYQQLQPFISSGNLIVKTYCQVSEAKWSYKDQEWAISLSTSERWSGDRIWLATGCKLDVTQDSLLSDVIKEFPIQILDGWPSISENLQWAPGCDLYLMGQYSALQIGPHAVNLAGGQAASARIAKAIHYKHREPCEKCTALDTTQAEQTQKEAYIQQMHGLMWL